MKFRLGTFDLDSERFELRREGERVHLQRLPLDLLLYLVRNRDRVVPRQELLDAVWSGLVVSDGSLSTAIYQLRRALEDGERDPPWLRTVRGRGFRYAGPCVVETGGSSPAREAVPFIARQEALAALETAASRAREGHGSVVFVPAAPGMGKTRLVREFLKRLEGMRVAEGRAEAEPAGPPGSLWEEVLAGLPGDAEDGSQDLHARVRAALSGEEACAVVLEDLHWAHPQSLGVLSGVVSRIGGWPALVVGTYRPDGPEPAASRLVQLSMQPGVGRVTLAPFGIENVYYVLGAVRGSSPNQSEVASVLRRSGGVPLYVTQLAHESPGVEGEPETGVLAAGLDRLSATARHGLALSALFGPAFELPRVEAVAGDTLPPERDWVVEALAAGILERDARRPLRLRFTHALHREAAAALLDVEARVAAHGRIAEILETDPDPPEHVAQAIARHYAAALPSEGQVERAIGWDLQVARACAERFAWEDVYESTTRLRGWFDALGEGKGKRGALEVELLHGAALTTLPNARRELDETVARATRLADDADRDERARLHALRVVSGFFSGDLERSRDGVAALRRESVESGEHLADCLEILVQLRADELEAAHATAERIAAGPRPDMRRFFPSYDAADICLANAAFASWSCGHDAFAVSLVESTEERARQRGDAVSQATILYTACVLHETRRDWSALRAAAARLDPLCLEYDVRRFLGAGFTFESWAILQQGGESFPSGFAGAVVRERAGEEETTSTRAYLLGFAGRLMAHAGELTSALECFDEAGRSIRGGDALLGGEVLQDHARLLLQGGDRSAALEAARRGLSLAEKQGASASRARALALVSELEGA